jgi:uncharacterized membrane protein
MAPQKQAGRRQAVSAKKKAGHGNNRRRSQFNLDTAAPVAPIATARPRSGPAAGAPADDLTPAGPPGSRGQRMRGWIRANPLPVATWIISLFALGVSVYLTITHYDTSVVIACSDKGVINCAKVTTSSQSMVFGVLPVAVLGLAFYVFMAVVNSPLGWRFDQAPVRWLRFINQRTIRWTRLGSVVVGMGFVLYLVYAEVIQIGNICLWCTSVHVLTFLLFALLVYDATSWGMSSAPTRR